MSHRVLSAAVAFLVLVASTAASSEGAADATASQGWHAKPHLGFVHGDHHVDLRLDFRYRYENWNAFVDDWAGFHGIRTRFGLDYRFRDVLRLYAEGQQTAVLGLSAASNGVGALYRNNNEGDNNPGSVALSQLFVKLDATPELSLLLGRSFVKMGTGVAYDQKNWAYLKTKRISQRLLGTVDWTNGARAYDGGVAHAELGGHHLNGFVLQPTTGVLVVDDRAFKRQAGIVTGGVDWTAPPGTLFEASEIGAYFVSYSDDRNPARVAGLFGDILVHTLGGHWLGVYPLGPGRVDALVWGAFQFGEYADRGPTTGVRDRDQVAGAAVGEIGYQLPDLWGKPWLRTGMNWGSGDDDPDDGSRHTFFNVLPTNHMYYGLLDQFALQNLLDVLVQLRVDPHPKVGIDLTYHRFWLNERNDFRWSGAGAFSRDNLGYQRNPSNGSHDAGHELDLMLSYRPHRIVSLAVGFSYLWGGAVFSNQLDPNAAFGWVQLAIRY